MIKPTERQVEQWGAGVLFLVLLIGAAAVYFWPKPKDPLCVYVKALHLECLALITDRQTYRPGAIARLTSDTGDEKVKRVELPLAYLDNESCIIPGATLMALGPRPEPFALRSVTYSFDSTASVGGNLAQGLDVNVGPKSNRIQEIDLSFGDAHTSLLDETILVDRIESCAIRPRCIQQIREQGYRVINRILDVDAINYDFKDTKGASLSIDALVKESAIKVGGTFDVKSKSGEGLKSKQPSAIAVNLIGEGVIQNAHACEVSVKYFHEGNTQVAIGGGGRPGHIQENIPQRESGFGIPAELSAAGTENTLGDFERTQSSASARALVSPGDTESEIRLISNVAAHGGHYGNRGPFGIGIASGHDTGANASAQVDGRINVLLRRPGGTLRVSWSGFPETSGGGGTATSRISVTAPNGSTVQQIDVVSAQGQQDVTLPAEGQYAVLSKVSLRAETSGASGVSSRAVDARVKATLE